MGNAGWRRSSKNDVVTEAARLAVVKPRKQWLWLYDDEEEQTTRAGRRRARAGGVPRAGGGGGGTVLTVKVVMRRKDAEALASRLEAQQGARARKARMVELKGELRAGGGARPAPCRRDACRSRPQLAPINEK